MNHIYNSGACKEAEQKSSSSYNSLTNKSEMNFSLLCGLGIVTFSLVGNTD